MEANVRRWTRESDERLWKVLEAVEAEGRVSSVGTVRVLRLYEKP